MLQRLAVLKLQWPYKIFIKIATSQKWQNNNRQRFKLNKITKLVF